MKATSDEHQAQSMKAQKEAADRWEAAQEQLRNLEAQLEQTRRNAEETEQESNQLSTNLVEQSREMAALKNNLVRAEEQPLRPKTEEKNAETLVLQMTKDLKDKEIQVKKLEGRVGKLQAEINELNTWQRDPDLERRAHGPVEEDRSQVETAIADPLTRVPAQENNGQNRPAMTEGPGRNQTVETVERGSVPYTDKELADKVAQLAQSEKVIEAQKRLIQKLEKEIQALEKSKTALEEQQASADEMTQKMQSDRDQELKALHKELDTQERNLKDRGARIDGLESTLKAQSEEAAKMLRDTQDHHAKEQQNNEARRNKMQELLDDLQAAKNEADDRLRRVEADKESLQRDFQSKCTEIRELSTQLEPQDEPGKAPLQMIESTRKRLRSDDLDDSKRLDELANAMREPADPVIFAMRTAIVRREVTRINNRISREEARKQVLELFGSIPKLFTQSAPPVSALKNIFHTCIIKYEQLLQSHVRVLEVDVTVWQNEWESLTTKLRGEVTEFMKQDIKRLQEEVTDEVTFYEQGNVDSCFATNAARTIKRDTQLWATIQAMVPTASIEGLLAFLYDIQIARWKKQARDDLKSNLCYHSPLEPRSEPAQRVDETAPSAAAKEAKEELQRLQAHIKTLEDQIRLADGKLSSADVLIQQLQKELKDSQVLLNKCQERDNDVERVHLKTELATKENEVRQLTAAIGERDQRIEELMSGEIHSLRSQVTELEAKIKLALDKQSKAEEATQQERLRADDLNSEMQKNIDLLNEMMTARRNQDAEGERLKEELRKRECTMKELIDCSQSMLDDEVSNLAELKIAYHTLLENFKTRRLQTGTRISRIQDKDEREKCDKAVAQVEEPTKLSSESLRSMVEAINNIASGGKIVLDIDQSLDDQGLIQSRRMADQLFESFQRFNREHEKAVGSLEILKTLLLSHFISLGDKPDQFEKWWGIRCDELNRFWTENAKKVLNDVCDMIEWEAEEFPFGIRIQRSLFEPKRDRLVDGDYTGQGELASLQGSHPDSDDDEDERDIIQSLKGQQYPSTGATEDIKIPRAANQDQDDVCHPSAAADGDTRMADTHIETELPVGLSPAVWSEDTPCLATVNGINAISSISPSTTDIDKDRMTLDAEGIDSFSQCSDSYGASGWQDDIIRISDSESEAEQPFELRRRPQSHPAGATAKTCDSSMGDAFIMKDGNHGSPPNTPAESDTRMADTPTTQSNPPEESNDGIQGTNEGPVYDTATELQGLHGSDSMMEDVSAENNTPTEEIGASPGADQRMTNEQRAAYQGQSGDSQPGLAAENDSTMKDASGEDSLPIEGNTAAQVTTESQTDSGDNNEIGSVETQPPAGEPGISRGTGAGSPVMENCGAGADDSIIPLNPQEKRTDNSATRVEALQDQTKNEPLPVRERGKMGYRQGIPEPGTTDENHTQESNCLQQSNQSATTLCGTNGRPNGERQLSAATESGSTQNTVAPVETQPLAKKDHASQSTDMGPQELVNSSIDAGQSVSTLQHSGTDRQDFPIPGPHTDTETPMHVDESIPSPMATSQTDLVTKEEGRRKRRRESLDGIEPSKATMGMTAGSKPVRRSKRLRGKEDAPSERVRKELAGRERVATRYLALCEKVLWDQERYFITWRCHEAVSESVYWAFGQKSKEGPSKPSPYRKDFLTEVEALKFYEDNIQRVRDKKDMNYKEDKERMLDLE
jgi:hypothetical protein